MMAVEVLNAVSINSWERCVFEQMGCGELGEGRGEERGGRKAYYHCDWWEIEVPFSRFSI